MVVAIIILSSLLVAATAFIFWLLKVLKNTLEIAENMMDLIENKRPRSFRTAYDGKYYPATAIVKMEFDAPHTMTITDFSMYESKKIVGFTIYTTESMEKYYGSIMEELDEDELELLAKPVLFENVLVYAPKEGMWSWKSVE